MPLHGDVTQPPYRTGLFHRPHGHTTSTDRGRNSWSHARDAVALAISSRVALTV